MSEDEVYRTARETEDWEQYEALVKAAGLPMRKEDFDLMVIPEETENEIVYRVNGKKHNPFGPAEIIWTKKNGRTVLWCEKYYLYDKLSRDDGPAYSYDRDGDVFEEHYKDGRLHNSSGPAMVRRNTKRKRVEFERWFVDDFPDSEHPNKYYYASGLLKEESYISSALESRVGEHMLRTWWADGTLKKERLYLGNSRFQDRGWDKSGNLVKDTTYLKTN